VLGLVTVQKPVWHQLSQFGLAFIQVMILDTTRKPRSRV
jgi:hypothetical protein